MKIRFAFAVLAIGAALSACNGWPDSTEAAVAENKPEKFPTYTETPAAETPTIIFENRPWMVSAKPVSLRGAKMQQVGTSGTVALYAPAGEASPYPVLFTPAGGTNYRRVLPIE